MVFILTTISLLVSIYAMKPAAEKNIWHAITLKNGRIYFGQIKSIASETIVLSDAYYLETYRALPNQNPAGRDFEIQPMPGQAWQVIKQGNDATFSTDQTLFINRADVVFWEKLVPQSLAVKAIEAKNKN